MQRFPQAEEQTLEQAVTKSLRRLDPSITLGWMQDVLALAGDDEDGVLRARNRTLQARPDDVKAFFKAQLRKRATPEVSGRRGPPALRVPASDDPYGWTGQRRRHVGRAPAVSILSSALCPYISPGVRLVHLSDLHLGFRQFQRQTPAGINQRGADVALAFARAVDKLIQRAPDVILIGGDVFHTVRPTNTAILHAFRQFSRLVDALPETHVIVVAGNHDMPRSTETICILRLFEQGFVARHGEERTGGDGATDAGAVTLPALPIYVADRDARRLSFPHLGLSVLAVPDLPPGTVELTPDPPPRATTCSSCTAR